MRIDPIVELALIGSSFCDVPDRPRLSITASITVAPVGTGVP